jgi:hypothetical protein
LTEKLRQATRITYLPTAFKKGDPMSFDSKLVLLLPLAPILLAPLSADEQNLDQILTIDQGTTPPTYTLAWWGTAGFHYLAETSNDLVTWTHAPNFNPSGANDVLSVSFSLPGARNFFRVIQFDPNDLTGFRDSDFDGLPDTWETFYFSGLGFSAADDNEPDGFSNLEEVIAGTKPNQAPDANSAAILSLSVWTPFR